MRYYMKPAIDTLRNMLKVMPKIARMEAQRVLNEHQPNPLEATSVPVTLSRNEFDSLSLAALVGLETADMYDLKKVVLVD